MWNLEGMTVSGKYLGDIPVTGKVELSRVAYGGRVKHTIVLEQEIVVFEAKRDRVILDQSEILSVKD
jgi:hypothetical protein